MKRSHRLALVLALTAAAFTAGCNPQDNCLTRGDCLEAVVVIHPGPDGNGDGGVRENMSRAEAELRGLEGYIERPASDTNTTCLYDYDPYLC